MRLKANIWASARRTSLVVRDSELQALLANGVVGRAVVGCGEGRVREELIMGKRYPSTFNVLPKSDGSLSQPTGYASMGGHCVSRGNRARPRRARPQPPAK